MSGEPANQLVLFRRRHRRVVQRRTIRHLLLSAPTGDAPPGHEDPAGDQADRDMLDVRPQPDGLVLAVPPARQRWGRA